MKIVYRTLWVISMCIVFANLIRLAYADVSLMSMCKMCIDILIFDIEC